MSDAPDPRSFYTERLPTQFNRAIRDQEQAVEEASRVLAGMRAVEATLKIEVRGEGGGEFFLNIEGGELSPGDEPAHPPVLTLIQDRPSFERLVAEAGDSALGFLGGLSGLAGEMKLTRSRLDNLTGVAGMLHFEVSGAEGFWVATHFGPDPVPDEPTTRIRVSPEAYASLRSGELNPQDAFLGGQIEVEGDMQLAMQVALAAIAPD